MNAPLSVALVSVMVDEAEADVAVVLAQLERSGTLRQVEPGWYERGEDARAHAEAGDLADWRARLIAYLVDGPGEGDGRLQVVVEEVLSWDPDSDLAVGLCELVGRLWAATAENAGLRTDPSWLRSLSEAGERAARATENPVLVGALLERAGRACADVGDPVLAESQLVRALTVWQEVNDEGRVESTLRTLIGLFSRSHRWGRALDAGFALLDVHRGRGQIEAAARTLALIADLMVSADRPDAALDYWDQADLAFTEAKAAPGEHAAVLVAAGRLRWARGDHGPGRAAWHKALALLVDVDDTAAERVRALLRLAPGSQLPA